MLTHTTLEAAAPVAPTARSLQMQHRLVVQIVHSHVKHPIWSTDPATETIGICKCFQSSFFTNTQSWTHPNCNNVQIEDSCSKQNNFSDSVEDEDYFATIYGNMSDEEFHDMMDAQNYEFYDTFYDQIFLFNDLYQPRVVEEKRLSYVRAKHLN